MEKVKTIAPPPQQSYAVSFWGYFSYLPLVVFCAGLLGLTLYFSVEATAAIVENPGDVDHYLLLLFILIILATAAYAGRLSLDALTSRLTFGEDFVEYKSWVRHGKIRLDDIRGYQARYPAGETAYSGKKIIVIVAKQNPNKVFIRVSPFIKHYDELYGWLQANYPPLLGRKFFDQA